MYNYSLNPYQRYKVSEMCDYSMRWLCLHSVLKYEIFVNLLVIELHGKGPGQGCAVYNEHGHHQRDVCQVRQCQADIAHTARQVRGTGCVHEHRVPTGDAGAYASRNDTSAAAVRRGTAHWCKYAGGTLHSSKYILHFNLWPCRMPTQWNVWMRAASCDSCCDPIRWGKPHLFCTVTNVLISSRSVVGQGLHLPNMRRLPTAALPLVQWLQEVGASESLHRWIRGPQVHELRRGWPDQVSQLLKSPLAKTMLEMCVCVFFFFHIFLMNIYIYIYVVYTHMYFV